MRNTFKSLVRSRKAQTVIGHILFWPAWMGLTAFAVTRF